MVKALIKWLILINNSDVADLVDLVKTLDSVLNELSEVHSALNSIGYSFDDNLLVLRAFSSIKELPSTLEVSTNTNTSSDSNLISWQSLVSLLYTSVSVSHPLNFEKCVF